MNVYLVVRGKTVEFASGEAYTIDCSGGRFEVFGYVASAKRSTATRILWKHKESGEIVKWHFEAAEDEPEVETSNILTSRRKRLKVDYEELDKQMDGHKPTPSKPVFSIKDVIALFDKWLKSSCSAANASIAKRKGSLRGELKLGDIEKQKVDEYYKSIGVVPNEGNGFVVSQSTWISLLKTKGLTPPHVEDIFSHSINSNTDDKQTVDDIASLLLTELSDEKLRDLLLTLKDMTVDTSALKRTKIGLTVNNITKHKDHQIASLAKELIDSWKETFRKEQAISK